MSRDSLIYRRRLRVASKKICNGSFKSLSKRDTTFCPSTRGCRRGLKRYRVSRTGRKHAEDEMRKIGEEIVKDCRQEKKEEAAMHRKQVIVAWRRCGNSLSLWERIESRLCSKGIEKLDLPRADARRKKEERRRDSKQEQEQGTTSQQLVLPAPGGLNEGTPASLEEVVLPRIRGPHGECGGAGKSGAANERKRTLSNSSSQEPLLRRMRAFELDEWCLKERAFWQRE